MTVEQETYKVYAHDHINGHTNTVTFVGGGLNYTNACKYAKQVNHDMGFKTEIAVLENGKFRVFVVYENRGNE